jgi:hypothetical protein
MDFITNCFEEYGGAFSGRLKAAGFSDDLVKEFLTEIASGIYYIVKNTNLEKTIKILLSDDPSRLLMSINVKAIATKLCISTEQVTAGIEAIAPVMSQVFLLKSNEIVAATASLAWVSTKLSVNQK